jgi:hypothetical protein
MNTDVVRCIPYRNCYCRKKREIQFDPNSRYVLHLMHAKIGNPDIQIVPWLIKMLSKQALKKNLITILPLNCTLK